MGNALTCNFSLLAGAASDYKPVPLPSSPYLWKWDMMKIHEACASIGQGATCKYSVFLQGLLTIFRSRAPKSDSAIECTWFLWKATGLRHFTVYSCWKTTCLPFKWHGLKLIALDVPQQSSCGHKAVAWHSDPSLNPILFGEEWSAQNTKPRTK